MGNQICKKCNISQDSCLLVSHREERRHCFVHNIQDGLCRDCNDYTNTHCYHRFGYLKFGV